MSEDDEDDETEEAEVVGQPRRRWREGNGDAAPRASNR